MTDVLTKAQRSYNMSRIGARNTGPEVRVRRSLREAGIRGYRIHSDLPGRPDIIFPKEKVAVFIDGCFWHGCPVDFKEPATRKLFWINKIRGNVARDHAVSARLASAGWTVLRIWEHEVRSDPAGIAARMREVLRPSRQA